MERKLTLEKKSNGLKGNYKCVFNLDIELFDLMKKAISKLEAGNYESCTQNNFIRSSIRNYSQLILSSKKIGKSFSN